MDYGYLVGYKVELEGGKKAITVNPEFAFTSNDLNGNLLKERDLCL